MWHKLAEFSRRSKSPWSIMSNGLLLHKPGPRMGVGLEEVQQLLGHFLAAGVAGMGAVADQIAAFPNQPVTLAGRHAVGPEIRTPKQQRRLHRAPFGVVIQAGVSLDLALDQPAHDEGAFVGIRFGVESSVGIAAVDPASQVGDPQVRKMVLEVCQHGSRIPFKLLAVLVEFAAGTGIGELDPGDLHLLARHA